MTEKFPRLLIAGLSGDSGKTIVILCLLTALRQKGLAVSVFKKGPDYIDSVWLSFAAKSDLIKDCIEFNPKVNIAGVILNRIAGNHHKKIITESIEKYCNISVLVVIPKFV